jgi:indoleamine 2,3-dioxygenase
LRQEMRSYMPEEHRGFLEAISKLPSLRSYVETRSSDARLLSAYNGCLKELSAWRSRHIGVVTTHIVMPARKAQVGSQIRSVDSVNDRLDTTDDSELQGTGGSALIPFLKQAKEETLGSCVSILYGD